MIEVQCSALHLCESFNFPPSIFKVAIAISGPDEVPLARCRQSSTIS
jgi:hypothetical protein